MDFWRNIQDSIDKGITKSADLLSKAKEKAVDLSEKGILKFEIMQLESQAEKRIAQLGAVVFKKLEEMPDSAVNGTDPDIMEVLKAISKIKDLIEEKEAKANEKDDPKGD